MQLSKITHVRSLLRELSKILQADKTTTTTRAATTCEGKVSLKQSGENELLNQT